MQDPSKQKDVATWSRRQTVSYIDAFSSQEMEVLPRLVDNVMVTSRSEVVATLWQFSSNVVTTMQSRNFTKYLTMNVQH